MSFQGPPIFQKKTYRVTAADVAGTVVIDISNLKTGVIYLLMDAAGLFDGRVGFQLQLLDGTFGPNVQINNASGGSTQKNATVNVIQPGFAANGPVYPIHLQIAIHAGGQATQGYADVTVYYL